MDDAGDVSAGLVVGRDAVVLLDSGGAGVVGGQSEGQLVVVAGEEGIEVGGAAADVLVGLEAVGDTKLGGGGGHELHEAAGSGGADGAGVAVALGLDQAGEQIHVEVVLAAGAGEHLAEVFGGELGVGGGLGRRRDGGEVYGRGRRIGDGLEGGDLAGGEFDVVVLAGAEVEADVAFDLGVVVAAHDEAVAQGDELGCLGGWRQNRKRSRNEDEIDADASHATYHHDESPEYFFRPQLWHFLANIQYYTCHIPSPAKTAPHRGQENPENSAHAMINQIPQRKAAIMAGT